MFYSKPVIYLCENVELECLIKNNFLYENLEVFYEQISKMRETLKINEIKCNFKFKNYKDIYSHQNCKICKIDTTKLRNILKES